MTLSRIPTPALSSSLITMMVIAFVMFAGEANGQSSEINDITGPFNQYKSSVLQEKIYLHTDREFYVAGEYMWFKVYDVDATFHKPLDVSRVCYVEVLDRENHAVATAKVPLQNGTGSGSLFLPATVDSENFTVRAYTRWMRNFDPAFYFHKSITIVNTFRSLAKAETLHPTITAEFFPEGGYLVEGLSSTLGVRVIDNQAAGVSFHGVLLNQNNDTVATAESLKFGIGKFQFTPEAGNTYTVLISPDKGKTEKFSLPEIKHSGYVMHVYDSANEILVNVKSVGKKASYVYLLAHTREVTKQVVAQPMLTGEAHFSIKKEILGEGISHLTLFDGERQPICERLYFKRPEHTLDIAIAPDQQEYGLRRKVTLDLSTSSEDVANASVSVYHIDSLQGPEPTSITTYLLLTSDLTGTIESPDYYFNTKNKETDEALDNLMLTHGWRRFSWTNIQSGNKPEFEFVPESGGLIISGSVKDANGQPVSDVVTILASPSKHVIPYVSRSLNGEINFEATSLWGNQKIIVQPYPGDSTLKISLKNPFSEKFSAVSPPTFTLPEKVEQPLLDRSIAMQVQDVYHEEQLNHLLPGRYDSTSFYGRADATYFLDDYTRFPVMEEVMREYVPNVWVRKRKDQFHFRVQDNDRKIVYEDNPLVLIDGVPVSNINTIMALDPLKIQKLEVMSRRYYLGEKMFHGVVSFSTYKGDLEGFMLPPDVLVVDYAGLQRKREFYAPAYSSQKLREDRNPDRRTLLYWNGDLQLSKNKKQLEFYTSDVGGRYLVVVEGITSNGLSGHSTHSFRVIK